MIHESPTVKIDCLYIEAPSVFVYICISYQLMLVRYLSRYLKLFEFSQFFCVFAKIAVGPWALALGQARWFNMFVMVLFPV